MIKNITRKQDEKKFTQQSVASKLQEFKNLEKLVIEQYNSGKPIPEIVRDNQKYYGIDE